MRNSTLIVTPYFKEPRPVLERCIRSVASQTVRTDHVLIADGYPVDWIDALPVRHIKLDTAHGNFGNTPRAIGLLLGIGEGYTGIGLLDADNWLENDHVDACLKAASLLPFSDYVVTQRRFARPDGTTMLLADEPLEQHVDTSCFFFLEGSFATLPLWGTMPNEISPLCDRIFYEACKSRGLRRALTGRVTVNFTVTVRGFFEMLDEEPPPQAKDPPDIQGMQNWVNSLDNRSLKLAEKRAGVGFVQTSKPILE